MVILKIIGIYVGTFLVLQFVAFGLWQWIKRHEKDATSLAASKAAWAWTSRYFVPMAALVVSLVVTVGVLCGGGER